jgi:hypothetical protein
VGPGLRPPRGRSRHPRVKFWTVRAGDDEELSFDGYLATLGPHENAAVRRAESEFWLERDNFPVERDFNEIMRGYREEQGA